MNGRKRKVQIKFYVTEEERALIEQKMKLVPTRNMTAYLRKIAIDGYIIQTDHSDIKAMTAEIQKIGVNINQIAKRVNATGSVYQEDIEFDLYFSFASVHAIAPFHSGGLGHFPTSNFQPTHRRAGERKYGKGYSFPMLATKLYPL
jgi:hypothetical protein